MYSESQVMYGLREFWIITVGDNSSFDSSTQIVDFMMSDGTWQEVPVDEIYCELEEFFGFKCSDIEWNEFWDEAVTKKLTFGHLARFIAERAPAISFDPATVLGRECPPAGVFLGLRHLCKQLGFNLSRFCPSDRIVDVIRGGSLDCFWIHLRWITENRVPELPAFWRNVTKHAFYIGFFGFIAAAFATVFFVNPLFLLIALGAGGLLMVFAFIYKHSVNPLPTEIQTFRDLANYIAGLDGQHLDS